MTYNTYIKSTYNLIKIIMKIGDKYFKYKRRIRI